MENEADNTKALFRRAQGYFHVRNFDKSEEDFLKLRDLDPNGTFIISPLTKLFLYFSLNRTYRDIKKPRYSFNFFQFEASKLLLAFFLHIFFIRT